MSNTKRTALGIATAAGDACAAAMISMGTAYALPATGPDYDGFSDLFGSGTTATNLDASDFAANPANAAIFDASIDAFESSASAHPITNLIDALDPSAFKIMHDPDIIGTVANSDGGYLVPNGFNLLGDLAVGLDYGLLNNTGLNFPLGALIDFLVGAPVIQLAPTGAGAAAADALDPSALFAGF